MPAAVILGICTALLILQWRRLCAWLPEFLSSRFATMREQLRRVSVRRGAHFAIWAFPSWILEAVVITVAARALGIELSLADAIAVATFTILFQVFHVTPGGIGAYDAVIAGALYPHGVPWQEGLTLAVAAHGLNSCPLLHHCAGVHTYHPAEYAGIQPAGTIARFLGRSQVGLRI